MKVKIISGWPGHEGEIVEPKPGSRLAQQAAIFVTGAQWNDHFEGVVYEMVDPS